MFYCCKAYRSCQAWSKCQLPNVPTKSSAAVWDLEANTVLSFYALMVCLEYRSNYSTSRTGTSGKVLAQWRCNYIVCNADRSCLDWTGGPPCTSFDYDYLADDDDDNDNDNDKDDDCLSGWDWGPPVQFSHATTYAATGMAWKIFLVRSWLSNST